MSYQPEPDYGEETPRLRKAYDRLASFHHARPAVFWFRAWLIVAVLSFGSIALFGFEKALDTRGILFAFCGWVVPFVIWIKQRRRRS